jgi:UPF0176 protein
MKNIHIILFYKFTTIDNPEEFSKQHLKYCNKMGLLGKVLVAHEGINGSLSGSRDQIESYKEYMKSQKQFSEISFKEEISTFHPFKKMVVRVKKEIIRMDQDLDLEQTGKYITPKELIELYSSDEDFIVLDTRNNYESEVGKFKGAITPDIDSFRDFPKALEALKDKKSKKIITYCTGGIRCEKATAYMVQQGYKDVYQLKDGILNFCKEYPNTLWEGKCFVFDQRLLSHVDPESKIISNCSVCEEKSDRYVNCKYPDCDDLIVLCEKCGDMLSECCSQQCSDNYKEYLRQKAFKNQGYKSRAAG